MTRELCRTLPPEWFEPGNDGARHALGVCRMCPSQSTCLEGDPRPHGVIRAGNAYAANGSVLPDCPTCGYPQTTGRGWRPDNCPRCEVPLSARWRTDILRWHADGVPLEQMCRWIGGTVDQLRPLIKTSKSTPLERTAA